ncbi:LOW QUALITY PROTEIN: hypothetical protein OSB04_016286 [Centaurea solstitialis]|uniref:F-box domain-containing protein n=1 Tax=Centaurea solstitialis TaxID=347529 RepID=A0AA38TDW7_9ASTR|nr:LOW QUALITY PROTEIN: hypothetical protein OSB04_016286 [Centaurea solstitialis]
MFDLDLRGWAYRPSFLKLKNFESEIVHIYVDEYRRKSMADEFFPHHHLKLRRRTSMEDLPIELTIHILSMLSFNAIIHCRLVCKKWLNLVSDSSFVDLHLSRSPTGIIIHHQKPPINMNGRLCFPDNPGALKWVETEDKVGLSSLDLNLAPILQNTDMRLLGSVNGLICLWQHFPKVDNTYICNPVTREYMILPRQRFQSLGFDEVVYGEFTNGGIQSGAGFCLGTITFECISSRGIHPWHGQWRSRGLVHVPYRLNAFRNFYGPYLNNHCHWIVCDKEKMHNTYEIGTFDLEKETFQSFPSPPPEKENNFQCQSLAILKGCLCKVDTCYFELRIWVMKEYGIKNSWQKEVVIKREISVDLKWQSHIPVHVIEGLKDGSILMVSGSKLCVFDPRSETDTKMFGPNLNALAYRSSFLKLQNFESEREALKSKSTPQASKSTFGTRDNSRHHHHTWNVNALDFRPAIVFINFIAENAHSTLDVATVRSKIDFFTAEEENHLKSMVEFFPNHHLKLRKKFPICWSGTSIEDLPEELMIHILSRLSLKTIVRCRLVCKKWRILTLPLLIVISLDHLHVSSFITTTLYPHVCLTGELIVPNNPGTLKWVETQDKAGLSSLDLNLAPILQNTRMCLVGSVNGLICLWQYFPNHDNTYICNPVTREYMILPRQRFQKRGLGQVVYGFGVSSLTGEYKVVRAFAKNPSQPSVLEAEVYTLGTGQWRSRGPVRAPYWLNAFNNFYGPYLNNHCHWIVRDKEEEDTYEIGTFDLDKEKFQLLPSPCPVKGNYFYCQSLAILKGCLCKLVTCHSKLKIWVMKEYGIMNSWQIEVVIKRGISVDLKWPSHTPVHLVAGLKDGSISMVIGNKLCVFDPRSETHTKMFGPNLSALAYHPSFLKLHNFESERVHMF